MNIVSSDASYCVFLVAVNICILRAPAVADALTTGRGAVIERSAGGAGQDCL